MIYKPGSVVLVKFPFTDLQSSKLRPALVLRAQREDVIILGIFSKIPDPFLESWIKIDEMDKNFLQTGLKKTSVIKTEKITVLHQSLVKKEIGSLPFGLLSQVKQILIKTLDL